MQKKNKVYNDVDRRADRRSKRAKKIARKKGDHSAQQAQEREDAFYASFQAAAGGR